MKNSVPSRTFPHGMTPRKPKKRCVGTIEILDVTCEIAEEWIRTLRRSILKPKLLNAEHVGKRDCFYNGE